MFIRNFLKERPQVILPPTPSPEGKFEQVAVDRCPICGSEERTILFEGFDRLHGLPGRFPMAGCGRCGSSYLTRRPVDVTIYYPPDSYAAYDGPFSDAGHAPGRNYGLARRWRLLTAIRPAGGKLLDVGCGAGDFLISAPDSPGWEGVGMEPSPEAVRYAREVRGLDVRQGRLPCPDLPDRTFDVITLWHVLEHVPDPDAVLTDIRRLLKPEGVLILSVPVSDSWEAGWFGSDWVGYDVPRHLVTFTRASLKQLLQGKGFRVEEQFGVVQGLASLRLSLGIRLKRKQRRSVMGRNSLGLILFPPLFLYGRLFRRRRLSVAVFAAHPGRSPEVVSAGN